METDLHELKQGHFIAQRAAHILRANPDCRDPDHPGCSDCDGSLEEREEELCNAFITAALRDVKAVATFSPKFVDYSLGVDKKFSRHSTVGEVMFESLDYRNGPEYDDLLQLLADAARGEDIRPKALDLVKRMGAKFAEMNVVVVL